MSELFEIVHEDAGLLIVNKPAGLVCHPTKGDAYSSLISRVRLYLGPETIVHLINRLDRETSGLVVVAKSDERAAGMRQRWESGLVRKTYLAVVEGRVADASGCVDAPIGPDPASKVAIKGRVCSDGAPSATVYERLHVFHRHGLEYSLLRVYPKTGRKHQIRIHLAHLGHPLVGDKIYGPNELYYLAFVEGRLGEDERRRLCLPNHALHAGGLSWLEADGAHSYYVQPEAVLAGFVEGGEPRLTASALWTEPTATLRDLET